MKARKHVCGEHLNEVQVFPFFILKISKSNLQIILLRLNYNVKELFENVINRKYGGVVSYSETKHNFTHENTRNSTGPNLENTVVDGWTFDLKFGNKYFVTHFLTQII